MASPALVPVDKVVFDQLVDGAHKNPHEVLGPHLHDGGVTIRALRPVASAVSVWLGDQEYPLTHEYRGVWSTAIDLDAIPDYNLSVAYGEQPPLPADDPYRYLPTLGDIDIHLIGEGRHEQLWQVLGAHHHVYDSLHGQIPGTSFAVWAPSAHGVRVVGDFNFWDGIGTPMRALGASGVWELFIPGVLDGAKYKFAVLGTDLVWREKADPMAFATETSPQTASVVFTSGYTWADQDWMQHRAEVNPHTGPMSIYEVHLGSWRRGLTYTQLADELTDYVRDNAFTHVELLPVTEHPYEPSWGYQVTSYFAPTSRFGNPDDFRYLIDRLHQAGISVIMDWVPAHFPKDDWALSRFDGTPLYEHPDPRRGEQPDWGTYVFNFGRIEVRNFLVANAVYWLEEFHIDGLRVDAVASMLYLDYSREPGEWVPNEFGGRENLEAVEFIKEMNATVYKRCPGVITIAEESTSWPGVTQPTHLGGLGFGLKWNMGWMHDSLNYMAHEPIYRQYHHSEMTFAMMYAYSEQYVLPLSHDEVVHGKASLINKMPGDEWQKLANLRSYYAYMWAHPGKQLLFMGGEFGQFQEWSEQRSIDWFLLDNPGHSGLLACIGDMNRAYRDTAALWDQDFDPGGFEWIDANDAADNVFSWLRYGSDGSMVACIANMAPIVRSGYRVGLPKAGRWKEVLNTDAESYGGSGVGNLGAIDAHWEPWHGRDASAEVVLPPLATVWLRWEG